VPKLPTFIVEDDPQLNLIFSLALQKDFDITACSDGGEALDFLAANSPEIIILDLNLPGASGEQILEYIRSAPHLVDTRIILATADAAKADYLAPRADLVLLKPISPLQLRDLTLRFSSKPQA
jgi:CheY-like chemotaxis protein